MRSNSLVSIVLEDCYCVDDDGIVELLSTSATNDVVVQYSYMIETHRCLYIIAWQPAFVEDLRNGLHIGWPSRADFDRPDHSFFS